MVTSSILRDERSWFCRPGHSSSLWHGGVKRFTNGAPCMFRRGVFPGFLCGTSVVRVVPRLFLAVVWRFQSKCMERLITIIGSSWVFLSRSCLVFSIEVWNDLLPSAGPPRSFSATMEVTSLRLPASFTVVVTCCHVLVYRVSARASAGVFSVRGFKVTTTAYVHDHFCTAFPGFYWWRPTWYGDSTLIFVVRRIRHFSLYAE